MIRKICKEDAAMFIELMNGIDSETNFLLFEAGERKLTVEKVISKVNHFSETASLFLVAEEEGQLVGFMTAERGLSSRTRHKAFIVVGILQTYTGKGLGAKLFEELEKWAKQCGVVRLELDVMLHNERAFRLYKKMGFKVEGIREKAVKIDGIYTDDYFMAKILN